MKFFQRRVTDNHFLRIAVHIRITDQTANIFITKLTLRQQYKLRVILNRDLHTNNGLHACFLGLDREL